MLIPVLPATTQTPETGLASKIAPSCFLIHKLLPLLALTFVQIILLPTNSHFSASLNVLSFTSNTLQHEHVCSFVHSDFSLTPRLVDVWLQLYAQIPFLTLTVLPTFARMSVLMINGDIWRRAQLPAANVWIFVLKTIIQIP